MRKKEPWAVPRGGHRDSGRSIKRGGGERKHRKKEKKKRVKTHAGDCTRKLFPKTTDREKPENYNTASFL